MPYENYTTYTEVEPDDRVQKTAQHIDAVLNRNEDTYVYKNKGLDFFQTFRHFVDAKTAAAGNWGMGPFWAVTNGVDDVQALGTGGQNLPWVEFYKKGVSGGNKHCIRLIEYFGAVEFVDEWINAAIGTWYYLTIERNGMAISAKIYSNSARTVLLHTLNLTLHDNIAFQYIYGCSSRNTGSVNSITLDIENLDLDLPQDGSQGLFAKFEIAIPISSGSRNLFAKFKIRRSNSQDLFVKFEIRHAAIRDLPCEFAIRHTAFLNLFAKFEVRHPNSADLLAELQVRHSFGGDLPSEFTVRHSATTTIFAKFQVRHAAAEALFNKFTVRHSSIDLLAELRIRHSSAEELLSETVIRHSTWQELFAEFVVRRPATQVLFAKTEIRHPGSAILPAEFVIRHSDSQHLFTEFQSRHSGSRGLFAKFLTRRSSTAEVFAELTVRHSGTGDEFAELVVRHSGIQDLFAEFEIQDSEAIFAKFIIRRSSTEALFAKFRSGPFISGYLLAEFEVRHEDLSRLFSKFIVRRTNTAELYSKFELQDFERLLATLTVRQGFSRDLPAEFELRNIGSQELHASFTVRHSRWVRRKIFSKFAIQRDTSQDLKAEFRVSGGSVTSDLKAFFTMNQWGEESAIFAELYIRPRYLLAEQMDVETAARMDTRDYGQEMIVKPGARQMMVRGNAKKITARNRRMIIH